MSSNFTSPVGRFVQGNLYTPNTTDVHNQPLVYKKGPKVGQPRVEYYFAVAIPKGAETHWNQTDWGQIIDRVSKEAWPQGQWQRPGFSWKVTDGDSTQFNEGTPPRRWCDMTGFAGNWVLKCTSSYFAKIYSADGKKELTEPNFVNLGDWVQVNINVVGNKAEQKPGVHLNPTMLAFRGYGERIVVGPSPTAVGFGQAPLPPGATVVPPSAPMPVEVTPPPAPVSTPVASAPPAPAPYPQILDVPPAPVRTMTALAQGLTYEQYKAAGWTDEQLISGGLMS